jgi:VCBS repeat-containing protein
VIPNKAGTYGSFSIDANGAWSYTASEAYNELNVGDSYHESFTVKSVDGTEQAVSITIAGTNDEPNHAPTAIKLTAINLSDSLPTTGVFATLSTTDPDVGDTHTYSIEGDAGPFTILGNSVSLSLDLTAGVDYVLNLRSTDTGGETVTESFRVITSTRESGEIIHAFETGDLVYGGGGPDNIRGFTGNDWLFGRAGDDLIYGGDGDDWLIGGSGQDNLTGGDGNDMFVFNTSFGVAGNDVIKDFLSGDKIVLVKTGTGLFGAMDLGELTAAAFSDSLETMTSSTRIIYDQTSGYIRYDADGSGSGDTKVLALVETLGLTPHPVLTYSDFIVI